MDIAQAAALVEDVTLIGLLIYCWQSERRERLDAQKRLIDKYASGEGVGAAGD